MKKNLKKMVLLNSEGDILTAHKTEDNWYTITDQYNKLVDILSQKEIQDFIHSRITLTDSKQRVWKYSEHPGTMKPDLKKLDEFCGIDTSKGTY